MRPSRCFVGAKAVSAPAFVALFASLLPIVLPARASACGCFTPPSPAVPVVQAGEQILFARKNGIVTAHIRIQYQGSADDFGWLLPLPSVPSLDLSTDELFSELVTRTTPVYVPTVIQECGSARVASAAGGGCGYAATSESGDRSASQPPVVPDATVVLAGSVGPYDYAVLKADDQAAMLGWLKANRYFVPAGIDGAVTPYIHPGAYFLALRLRAGESVGSLLPVVVRYASDLPMIPIVLTQVGATPKMPVTAFLLGEARGIPRNFHHVVLNEAAIDWARGGANYLDVVTQAVAEAPARHAFVTEYAGSSSLLQGVLDPPARFGEAAGLRDVHDPGKYVTQLRQRGFAWNRELFGVLSRHIPKPQALAALTDALFYADVNGQLRGLESMTRDGGAPDPDIARARAYDPAALTDELWMRIVEPTRTAGALFRSYPHLTRLFTVLSPEDMTADPVFDENADLPDVDLTHPATLRARCGASVLELPDGTLINYAARALPAIEMPRALRLETLAMTGAPKVVTDNQSAIDAAIEKSNDANPVPAAQAAAASSSSGKPTLFGCAVSPHPGRTAQVALIGSLLVLGLVLRRRSPRG